MEIRRWFTLFFMPVIPYLSKNILLCQICSHCFELDNEQLQVAKELNGLTAQFLVNDIDKTEYLAQVRKLHIFGTPPTVIDVDNAQLPFKETVQDLFDGLALVETSLTESQVPAGLPERYAAMDTKELIKVVSVCKSQYTTEAIHVAKAELKRRKVPKERLEKLLKEAQAEEPALSPSP